MRPAARHGGVRMQMDFLKRNENQAGMGDRAGRNGPGGTPGALGYPGPCRGAVNKLDVFNSPFKMSAWIPAFFEAILDVLPCVPLLFDFFIRQNDGVQPSSPMSQTVLKNSF